MATTERDYYELLGVARDASESEIKKAFRGLARELHPDVSNAPDADSRFREVVEVYEVLSVGSPLGQALMGAKPGQTVAYAGPRRELSVVVVSVRAHE